MSTIFLVIILFTIKIELNSSYFIHKHHMNIINIQQPIKTIIDNNLLSKTIPEIVASYSQNHNNNNNNDVLVVDVSNLNKGNGAGGANTNLYGKKFEEKTNHEPLLNLNGYTKQFFNSKTNLKSNPNSNNYYLSKTVDYNNGKKTITFVSQTGFKKYMKKKYNIDLFRFPDEAYIIEYDNSDLNPNNLNDPTNSPTKKIIKILEKKEQHVNGSVETKLWSSPSLKREYELILGNQFEVNYGLCLSKFLQNKIVSPKHRKYTTLNTILNEANITCLFGDDDNYFELLNNWIHS